MRKACQMGEEQIPVCETCVGEEVGPQPMMKARKKIPKLKITCPLATRGCKWNATLDELDKHLDVCQEFLIKCKYDCGVITKRCELNNHCNNECLNRKVSCEHCQSMIVYQELNQHFKECPEFPLLCPNNCATCLKRKQIDSHIETECPNTVVECRYERFGCKQVVKRCEMEEHKKTNETKHLEMTTFFAVDKIEKLKEKHSQMSSIIENLSYPVVLRDKLTFLYLEGTLISRLLSFFLARYCFSWQSIILRLKFGRPIQEVIPICIMIVYNKVMTPLLKWLFEGRFKLTIIDRVNTNSSLVYQSAAVKLRPEESIILPSEYPNRFELATIATNLLQKRFRTEDGEVEFTLQIQEAENIRILH